MAKKNQLTTSDHLPYTEYLRLLDCLHKDKNYRWEMYARVSFCTACRVSDVLMLKWRDILNTAKLIVTEKKTGKTRAIPIDISKQQKFKELYDLLERPGLDEFILPSSRGDKPITVQYVNQQLKDFKWRYKIKIENFSSHTFRKTFGRYVYDSNNHSAESLLLLNRILNHSNIQTTKTYIGITQDEIDGVFNSIKF